MIAIPIENVDNIIVHFSESINDQKNNILIKLNNYANNLDGSKENYVRLLIDFFENSNGLIAKKDVLIQKRIEFDNICRSNDFEAKDWKKFKDKLLNLLGYSIRRGDFFPEYFHKIGIKSCVFCNSQLCVTVNSKRNKLIAKFQVDHFLNKNDYPCFSVSLFNLYPVCGSCNLKKRNHEIDFDLYVNSKDILGSNYKFQIKDIDASVGKFLLDRNINNIKIEFIEPVVPVLYKQLNDVFSIEGIYDTQKDIVEELILKAEVYKQSYKKTLIESFPEIFNSGNITNRLIVGNYCDENEIHKRPMAKFQQDIAKQLGLI